MWKLLIKLIDGKEYLAVPHATQQYHPHDRGARSQDLLGFTMLSEAMAFAQSERFIDYLSSNYGDGAEIMEVLFKFEDVS